MIELDTIYNMDCLQGLKRLPDCSVDCCVTSPPYFGLRDYGVDGQIGLEETPQAYIDRLTEVFMEVYRVLKPTGTLWLNIGDSYATGTKASRKQSPNAGVGANCPDAQNSVPRIGTPVGCKTKDLIGIPWMLAFSLRNEGWYLRQDIIWAKPNAMPESVTDRLTKSHEYIFLMSKSRKYYFDHEAIQEVATGYDGRKDTMMHGSPKYNLIPVMPQGKRQDLAKNEHQRWRFKNLQEDGQQPNTMHLRRAEGLPDKQYPVRNKRSVWFVNTKPDHNAHFAVYPEELIRPCILAGCPKGGVVLDPFMGSGTTARVARHWGRHYVGFELNSEYMKIINEKTKVETDLFAR